MAFNVAEFRSQLQYDGARPNLFSVSMPFPALVTNGSGAQSEITYMARTSQLPGMTNGTVPLFYFGREVKLAGNRTFPDWTLTVINDEDMLVRKALEQWMNALGSNRGNLRNPAFSSATSYGVDAQVNQYSKTGGIIKNYKFVGMFPVDLAPIDLDWASNDTIEEYSVTFAYQWFEDQTNGIF